DMIRNAKKESMEDIIKRQALIGGVDLYDFIDDESDGWKKEDILARNEFIIKFYQYAKDRRGWGIKTWTEWIAKNK
ncbi:MAG: hypothetical protein AB7V32_07470, partial [Candidatus Berkiella sp.]